MEAPELTLVEDKSLVEKEEKIRAEVALLDLRGFNRETLGVTVGEEIYEQMRVIIATTNIETSALLNSGKIDIFLAEQADSPNGSAAFTETKVSSLGNHGSIIYFVTSELKTILENMASKEEDTSLYEGEWLRLLTAHERYHGRKNRKRSLSLKNQDQIAASQHPSFFSSEWIDSREEYAANLFAFKYMRGRDTKNEEDLRRYLHGLSFGREAVLVHQEARAKLQRKTA